MANALNTPIAGPQRTWIACLALSGALLSVAFFALVRSLENREAHERAAEVVRKQVEKLEITMLRSMEVLNGIASLHAAHRGFNEADFRAYVSGALRRQPELQALSWNPVVAGGDRAEFEAGARAAGLAGYRVQEAAPGNQFTPASNRDFYVPVRLIEPRERNSGALGYDLVSEPSRRRSLEQARDTGKPVATAPIHLAQETADHPGFLVLMPVYSGPPPVSLEQRRSQIEGFAVAVFKLSDLVSAAFLELASQGVAAWLLDQTDPERPIYHQAATGQKQASPAGLPVRPLELAGRRWSVAFAPTGSFLRSSHMQSWMVLGGGLAFAGLAVYHVQSGARRLRQVAEANQALSLEVIERKKAEAAAAAANQAKSDFLANMSHEIRTPLNAILGHTQLMQRDPALSTDQQDAIAGISVSGHHLLGLINEILDLAKIEAGRMELNPAPMDLAALLHGLEATFKPLCAQKRIAFSCRHETFGGGAVIGDEGKLRQVLINLLGNALKFTSAGGIQLTVRPEPSNRWVFEVADTGPGIPTEEQGRIFNPFQQGRFARHHGGSGLGLAIAQRQVELMGGRLTLVSEQSVGSRFSFAVPMEPALAPLPEPPAPVVRIAAHRSVRALVVDDRKPNRDVLGGMLTRVGCVVDTADGAESALLSASNAPPDVVFLDLLMPGEGGAAVARQLLLLPRAPGAPRPLIIAHTAASGSNHVDEAIAAGCVECLPKPLQAEQVYAALERHLSVQFERAAPESGPIPLASIEGIKIALPEELCSRLAVAAELHSATALKGALNDLRRRGDHAVLLADHIRHLMRSYDMDGIQRLLAACVIVESTAEASTTLLGHGRVA